MKKKIFIASTCAFAFLVSGIFVTACTVTRKPDGTIVAGPADGKKVQVPPERVPQISIDGKCYYSFRGRDGILYCFSCELEGDGYAEPCDSLLPQRSVVSPISPTPYNPPSAEELQFRSFLSEWLVQENIPFTHDAVWDGFALGQWQDGWIASVPTALVEVDDSGEGSIKIMMISRTDWEFPDNSNGSVLEYYFLRDASDSVPDAMVLQLSGSFQQVADSIKSFYDGPFTMSTEYDGSAVLISGNQSSVTFSVDGVVLWEG